ncbi:hypothetical protein Taro_043266 [Colocasia esculenta]|uniref:Aminotransferase-like plant mobile domain-containing protein n=1 Tax=Colocasia esculenta TaxID=4460 RepID=A0A843WFZ0_COLES|nr:hypothetical protein [Colocasia esculenta]
MKRSAAKRRGEGLMSTEETATTPVPEASRTSEMVAEMLAAPGELAIVPVVEEDEAAPAGGDGGTTLMDEEEVAPEDDWGRGGEGDSTGKYLHNRRQVSRAFLFPWGHKVPSLEDVARIIGLRSDELGDRRMVGRVALLGSLGLRGVRQRAEETLPEFMQRAAGLAQAMYGQDPDNEERVDRDLRRFLVFFLGKMLLTTKGNDIHCRFLELLEDLERVRQYAWGAAFLAHTFAVLSSGTGRETTVGGFVPFLQICPDAVPLVRRWLPVVTTATYSIQLDILRRDLLDFPAVLGDQPWVESGRPRFGWDLWAYCLDEIEPLWRRLATRTLGLHQAWHEETEPRGIGRRTWGKAKMVDWRLHFPEQYANWQRGGQLVESDATDSLAYLQYNLINTLRAKLAVMEAQLAKAREALDALVDTSSSFQETCSHVWDSVSTHSLVVLTQSS